VFSLTDRSFYADDEWYLGQVEVYKRHVVFETSVVHEKNKGYVALDEFFEFEVDDCLTLPEQARVSTVPPETTTQASGSVTHLNSFTL
jgi:hypothetical protein